MSASRNLEERAKACLANFEVKIDSLVTREKESFKEFCQSQINKVKNNTSFEDSGIPDFDSSSVVNSTVIPQTQLPDLDPPGVPVSPVFPIQVYVPPPVLLARLATLKTPTTNPERPIIVPVRRSHRKFRETNKFAYSPSHIKSYKPRKRKRTMSLERVRCNLNDEFEAEEEVNLSLEAEIEAIANCDVITTPTSPRSPIPVAVVQPRVASPFPVGHGEPDLFDLMTPVDAYDSPAAPTATPVPLDEVSLYGEVEADADLADLDDDYVGIEQTAQLYEEAQLIDEVGLGMEQLSDNDEEVERINRFLEDTNSEVDLNLDTPSTGMTSVPTSCPSLSEVDLTCNEDYEPNFGGVRFEDDDETASTEDGSNNNDDSNPDASESAASTSVASTSTSSAPPPPYQPPGTFRCHQCGAINNVTPATAAATWTSPPPPYASPASPAQPADAPPAYELPAHNDDGENLNDLFSGSDQEINMIGMQPSSSNFNRMQPPDDYSQQEQIPFRDLLGPADDSDDEDK